MGPIGNSLDEDKSSSSFKQKRNFENAEDERPQKKLREGEYVDEFSSTPSLSRDSAEEELATEVNKVNNAIASGDTYIQKGYCFKVAPNLEMCRECCLAQMDGIEEVTSNIFCRFIYFRKLKFEDGELKIAGYSDPRGDSAKNDLKMWMPDIAPTDLKPEMAQFLISQVGDQFCDLVQQELEATDINMNNDETIVWKKAVQKVREMCDVCDTTLFNFHWVCKDCGFAVCIDCYKSRKSGTCKLWGEHEEDRDEYYWLLCTDVRPHVQRKLMLTQIIAGDALTKLGTLMHSTRLQWGIESQCDCSASKQVSQETCPQHNKIIMELVKSETPVNSDDTKNENKSNGKSLKGSKKETLSWLDSVAPSSDEEEEDVIEKVEKDSSSSDCGDKEAESSSEEHIPVTSLRSMLFTTVQQPSMEVESSCKHLDDTTPTVSTETKPMVGHLTAQSIPVNRDTKDQFVSTKHKALKYFVRRKNYRGSGGKQYPIRVMTKGISAEQYPDVPHFYLCEGKLLVLEDPSCENNYDIFQEQWKRGQPVMVLNVADRLQKDLWHPERFAQDFGTEKANLVNCMSGFIVPNTPLKHFWEGFDSYEKRLKDYNNVPMLLKLKDWPPAEDFADILPVHMADLMQALPLGEYTHRTGKLNLAARLPDTFVRPDLGPKMYNAYGSPLHPDKGTTNLHLDISDAVNVMVYAGCCIDKDDEEERKAVIKSIDEAGCDLLTKRRVREKGVVPGALWHIFNARDADAIRDLLNVVSMESGKRLEPHHDPIHDQSWYLDGPLRLRLYKEYGVEGYAIAQCMGDAIFVPAGAPHQVRNLHNCIKIAEDFVSPENVSHCFHLTQEFRDLTDNHTNHEDKLQIKNIMYHTVKDSLAVLNAQVNGQIKVEAKLEMPKAEAIDI